MTAADTARTRANAQEMPNQIKLLLPVSCLLAMSSCATVLVRSGNEVEPAHVFPATKIDACFFWDVGIKGDPFLKHPSVKSSPCQRLRDGVGAIMDFPFSVVTDSILLPSDLIRIERSDDEKTGSGEQGGGGNSPALSAPP